MGSGVWSRLFILLSRERGKEEAVLVQISRTLTFFFYWMLIDLSRCFICYLSLGPFPEALNGWFFFKKKKKCYQFHWGRGKRSSGHSHPRDWSKLSFIFYIWSINNDMEHSQCAWVFPGSASSKEPACQFRRPRFHTWVGKIPWRMAWQPTPVFSNILEVHRTEEPGGPWSLGSQRGRHDWSTRACTHTHTHTHTHECAMNSVKMNRIRLLPLKRKYSSVRYKLIITTLRDKSYNREVY